MLTPECWYRPPLSCSDSFGEIAGRAPHLIDEIANGCGDGWRACLIPNTMYGLSILPACQIHDWDYHHGATIDDKEEADRRFLNNLLRIIEAHSANHVTRALRNRRALKYYEAVRIYGGPAFWQGKE
jgi:hypothetical protein